MAEERTAPHLRLEGVSKRFGAHAAVNRIVLDVPRGQFTTLLGPSGCGKTTLLRLIAGFFEPDEGRIVLNERVINNTPAHQRGTAMVFQDYALFPHMRVYDNVAYGLRLARLPHNEIETRARETLKFVGLDGLERRYPNELSGGQQQRVALARALVVRPEVLLLDEPLSNLDAKVSERIRWELRALQRRLGMTFIYVTHDQEEALAMSDFIAVMNNGQVEQSGAPWEIYYQPRTAFLADFVGAVNLFPVDVLEQNNGTLTVRLDEHVVSLPSPGETVPERVLLCIRPESLTFLPPGASSSAPCIQLTGTITRRAFLGNLMRYWVQVGKREWIADQPDPGAAPPVEGAVTMSIALARVHVIAGAA